MVQLMLASASAETTLHRTKSNFQKVNYQVEVKKICNEHLKICRRMVIPSLYV